MEVVAGGWLEAPPQKTKRIKLLLEELGWLSKTSGIRPAIRHSDAAAATGRPDLTAVTPPFTPAPKQQQSRLLPLTDVATAALEECRPVAHSSEVVAAAHKALLVELNTPGVLLRTAAVCGPASRGVAAQAAVNAADAPPLRFIDLFAGVGGFRLGLEAAGAECVWGCEIDSWARATYAANFGTAPSGEDITRTPGPAVPEHDILVGGFPCQPFSGTGRRKGIRDERDGGLFLHICRLLRERQPAGFILENVRGLLTLEGGATWATVRAKLATAGYTIYHQLLEAADVLPQKRARLFIVGFRADVNADTFTFPTLPKLGRGVGQILEPPQGIEARHWLSAHQWGKVSSQAYYTHHSEARVVVAASPATTLQSSYKSGYMLYSQFVPAADHPTAPPRFYTPRECARLQGFPETFEIPTGADEGRWYKQIGNAVPPPLVAVVAAAVVAVLRPTGDPGRPPASTPCSTRHHKLLFDTLAAASPDPQAVRSLNSSSPTLFP